MCRLTLNALGKSTISNPAPPPHPKVFVTYSHDSEQHRERVLGLAQRLRKDGFETMIDQYVQGTPPQGWPRWMLNQIDWADYILLVCTKTYYRRFRGDETSDVGRGVDWEGAIITNELYDRKSVSERFVPVLFDGANPQCIPEPVRSFNRYVLTNEKTYTQLTDHLAGAAGVQPAKVGPPPERKRRTGAPLRFGATECPAAVASAGRMRPDLSTVPAPGGRNGGG